MHRFQRAVSAGSALKNDCANARDCTLEAMRTQVCANQSCWRPDVAYIDLGITPNSFVNVAINLSHFCQRRNIDD